MLKNSDGRVVYTPPEGQSVIRGKLRNLETFIHEKDELDPLIKMAVLHYQFEAIHPFPDGNGRTGRILNLLYLVDQGLLDIPVMFLSRYILQNRAAYYQGLQAVTERGDWEAWLLYMLDAVETTAQATHDKIVRIRDLMEQVRGRLREDRPSIYSKDLVEAIFAHPYTKIQFLVDAGIAKRQTASSYLQELVSLGMLEEVRRGRDKYYINRALLRELAG